MSLPTRPKYQQYSITYHDGPTGTTVVLTIPFLPQLQAVLPVLMAHETYDLTIRGHLGFGQNDILSPLDCVTVL